MSLTRRTIILAVVALTATVSLMLATSAKAAIKPPPKHPTGVTLLVSQDAKDKALAECRAKGGTWIEAPDPNEWGTRIGICTWEECDNWREVDIGVIGRYLVTLVDCAKKISAPIKWKR